MKRKWHHPEAEQNRGKLVRGVGELEDTPEFRGWLEREFPAGAAEMRDGDEQEHARRTFLKLMGASTALAGFGLAACRRPEQHIRPFSKAVEWIIPGKPLYYATAMPRPGGCTPLVVETHEGRPTHLQPNPLHPSGRGMDSFATASILELYDPERSSKYLHKGVTSSAEDFGTFLNDRKTAFAADGGTGLAVLYGESTSPTRARLVKELRAKFPQAKFFRYEPLAPEKARAATDAVSGKGTTLSYDLSKADAILSIGSDFLGLDRIGEDAPFAFARRRAVDDPEQNADMNRLYVLEHAYTVTGGMADHRLPVNASQLGKAAVLLAKAVGEATGDAALGALAGGFKGSTDTVGIDPNWIAEAAKDLASKKGRSLVLAGPRLEAGVHALVAGMNAALQAYGATVSALPGEPDEALALTDLVAAIGAKEVSTLVITTEADPVYDAPADLEFAKVLAGVASIVHVGVRRKCATARAATWHVPGAHYLESWGDVRASDGTYSVVQPMILPLYDGLSEIAFYLDLLADPPAEGEKKEEAAPAPGVSAPDDAVMVAVKETFADVAAAASIADADKAWDSALRDGFVPGTATKAAAGQGNVGAGNALVAAMVDAPAPSKDALEVVFTADSKVYDGRYINNGWLQEAPDSITKIVWDNAALVGIKTLKALGLEKDDLAVHDETRLLKLTVNGVDRYFPILPAPGHSQNSISISMGYGQEDCGKVGGGNDGSGTGFSVFPLRTSATDFVATGAVVEIVGDAVEIRPGQTMKFYPLALTQEHNSMEGRALMRDGTLDEFKEEHTKAGTGGHHGKSSFQARGMDSHIPENVPVYHGQNFDFEDTHQWGMTIDLNTCIGCSSCLVACQSENNIPIVGKEQVIIGREMHWIRMDRYFAPATKKVTNEEEHTHEWVNADEDLDNPQLLPQPVACQQCEAAPCETVCPVNATVHNEEGLNVMAYNRCIGTRYCANNCPYKARRFNFFDYNKRPLDQLYRGPLSDKDQTGMPESLKLQKNPNVTVRMRGVMEKCTYCVQRLQEAKIRRKRIARDEPSKLAVPDGAVKTACQVACPTEAIVFGDLRDNNSAVSRSKQSIRNYDLLAYIGTRPRTSYLARIKNPNPSLEGDNPQVGRISERIH